ncbi:MAG TPA: hypothetical protein VF770_05130, partial [Solirubrobacterales bacterium]
MRGRLAVSLALASGTAMTVLGVGVAGAEPPAPTGNGQLTGPAPILAPTLSEAPPPPACSNGVDDDADGLADLTDPDCTSPSGESEEPPSEAGGEEAPSGAVA